MTVRGRRRRRLGEVVCSLLRSTGVTLPSTRGVYIHHMLTITQQRLSIQHQRQEALSHLHGDEDDDDDDEDDSKRTSHHHHIIIT
jgi:hypothetical protein